MDTTTEVEHRLLERIRDAVSRTEVGPEHVQIVFTSAIHLYLAASNSGKQFPPLEADSELTPTDLVIAVTEALEQASIEIFELGMWATWGHADR